MHPPDPNLVREELARIEHSAAFRQSKQLRAFLRHLIVQTLAGDNDHLKEIALALDVFRRDPASYDPRKDPIVRVEAGRLREKLAQYYVQEGSSALVEVVLPVGSYIPEFHRRARTDQTGLTIPSLIVLPVANSTGDTTHEAFCDGLTDELMHTFARFPGLKVIARTTAFQFKNRNEDARTIGRRVGAATVLQASVQQRDEQVRIIAQLVQAIDGATLWSRGFTCPATAFLESQEALAHDVGAALQRQFSAHPSAAGWALAGRTLIRRGTNDETARDLHDRGRAALRRVRVDTQRLAIELFREAARRDPQFALAHSGEGAAWTNLAALGAEPGARALPLARAAAQRALVIDPELYEALSVEGYVAFHHDFDAVRGEALYREGLRLNPSATYLRLGYAWILTFTGRTELAAAQFEIIRELEPLDIGLRHNRALFLFATGRWTAAETCLREILEVEPADVISLYHLALLDAYAGRGHDATRHARAFAHAMPGHLRAAMLTAQVEAASGGDELDAAQLGELEAAARQASAAFDMATVHAALGNSDDAFRWLETAATLRDVNFVALPVAPQFRSLHDDPRWPELLARYRLVLVPASRDDAASAAAPGPP